MSADDLDVLINQFFCQTADTPHGPYRPGGDAELHQVKRELLGGILYRYDLVDVDRRSVVLNVYRDVSAVGGLLWEQEVRILLRISSLRHPALPEILDGGYEPGSDGYTGFAFVVTRGADFPLSDYQAVLEWMNRHPMHAIAQFAQLTDALAHLHGMAMVHRNLWPRTIDGRDADGRPDLVLARFEMSTLVANLLRSATVDATSRHRARELLLGQDLSALQYYPPERMTFLFPVEPSPHAETDRSDTYGLGAIVWEWFLGPMPAAFDGASPDDGPDMLRRARELRQHLLTRLTAAAALPRGLRDLITGMLAERPAERPAAGQVAAAINALHAELLAFWSEESGMGYLVTFMPWEFSETIYRWGWTISRPTDAEGREELTALIENDLRRVELYYTSHGANPYVNAGDPTDKAEARHVLMGGRAAWFCKPYQPPGRFGGRSAPVPEVLLIKYVVSLESGSGRALQREVNDSFYRQRVPLVQAIPADVAIAEFELARRDRPSWEPLLAAVRAPLETPAEQLVFQQAFDWLLEYQQVELRAREYPFVRLGEGRTGIVRLVYDAERDLQRRHRSAMDTLYAGSLRRRPPFADFFGDELNEDGDTEIEVYTDEAGRRPGTSVCIVRFHDRQGDDLIEVSRRLGEPEIPERGWLRPRGDRGSDVALRRQLNARGDMLNNRVLIGQLQNPRALAGRSDRWRDAGAGLLGGAQDAVVEMLTAEPFFALQGPPGTGKTEVVAHAVRAYLDRDRGARILVSAQSNFALDNVAERILELIGGPGSGGTAVESVIPLRIAARGAGDRVSPTIAQYQDGSLAENVHRRLVAHARERLDTTGDPATGQLLASWLRTLDRSGPELLDRLRRGANLVFATCSASTDHNMFGSGAGGVFDWVIVEEAAKAWPTELAIPLARGIRWTLVGDHRQLPAHRRREITDFLAECALDALPELREHGMRHEQYTQVFDMFASLFETNEGDASPVPAGAKARTALRRPLRTLTTQFRMNEPIGELVSRVFYPAPRGAATGVDGSSSLLAGTLDTGRPDRPHGLDAPRWLAGHSLVWWDTGGVDECADQPAWSNAGEARLVSELVNRLRPTPKAHRLAVLTPYRQQADLLRSYQRVEPHVSTVHTFQGREADIVIVSLVRDTVRGTADQPWHRVGHLTQEQLVNVMMSRAKKLLVLVGRYQHFRDSGVDFWKQVCTAVADYGVIVPARSPDA